MQDTSPACCKPFHLEQSFIQFHGKPPPEDLEQYCTEPVQAFTNEIKRADHQPTNDRASTPRHSEQNDMIPSLNSVSTGQQTDQNLEKLSFPEMAKQLEQTRSKLCTLLVNSLPGLVTMAREYLDSIDNGVSPSDLFSSNRNKIKADGQAEILVQPSAKQIEAQTVAIFQHIMEQEQVLETKSSMNTETAFLAALHFLPIFLLQVSTRVLNQFSIPNRRGFNPLLLNQLATQVRQMIDLRTTMITNNLGLVIFIARQYRTKTMTDEDLQQEGTIGLVKAVDRFDHRRQLLFSTYAAYWIRQAIVRGISKNEKLVRVPINLASKAPAVFEMMDSRISQTNRWPNVSELSRLCGLSEFETETILEFYLPMISLDGENSDDKSQAMIDCLEQQQFPSAIATLSSTALRDSLHFAVRSLSEKEARVICCRYGLENQIEMTLQDIATTLKVTRERVRQIQNNGLKKLKTQFGSELDAFLEAD